MEGCPLLTHHGLRAIAEASVEAGRPLLGALRVLNLSQSAGGRPGLGFVDPGWQLVFLVSAHLQPLVRGRLQPRLLLLPCVSSTARSRQVGVGGWFAAGV